MDSRDGWQPLAEHLHAVGSLAAELARAASPGHLRLASDAELSGLLHDYGKYSDCFQRMLVEGRGRCQHSIHGAMLSYFGADGDPANRRLLPSVWCIAGHHGGLPNKADLDARLEPSPAAPEVKKYRDETLKLLDRARRDSAGVEQAVARLSTAAGMRDPVGKNHFDLYTRMLFSCLVDADRLDSTGRGSEQQPLDAGGKRERLLEHLRKLGGASPPGVVKEMRAQVLRDCLKKAKKEDRSKKLFSLSVPTGGGKTLAAMAFALQRAAHFPSDFRRVIVVIPYLSIIEQNAEVYAEVFGKSALLEHHSGSLMRLRAVADPAAPDDPEKRRFEAGPEEPDEPDFQNFGNCSETENWDAPLIVTTSVRFFESLFSNRPKDLRRVHNIARSIVILDEVQTLPRNLVGPLLGMMKELADDWGVNFVFSTATQPAFQSENAKNTLLWKPGTLREIVGDPEPLRKALKRAEISWEIETPMSWPQVAERALRDRQSLAIVNLRDHARELYDAVLAAARERGIEDDAVFHLSTRMCAAHRLRVIGTIRDRLKAKLPCHVVSTQLVEAGVDLDFPLVLRALAPLDSIVQAAGRADREGKLTANLGRPGGRVVVFRSPDDKTPPNEYAEATGTTRTLAAQSLLDGESIQVDDSEAMKAYYRNYYSDGQEPEKLGSTLVELRLARKFKTLADEFEMIGNRTKDVYVGHDDEARQLIAKMEKEFREKRNFTPELRDTLRLLQRSFVGLGPWEFDKAKAIGVIDEVVADSGIWIAVDNAYTERFGLALERSAEDLIL
jgi:CRISPR-associated endonuclease/helicase Cas3